MGGSFHLYEGQFVESTILYEGIFVDHSTSMRAICGFCYPYAGLLVDCSTFYEGPFVDSVPVCGICDPICSYICGLCQRHLATCVA